MNYDLLFAIFAFVLGASIGSFLNVCIYRMPRDLGVNEPSRSFCPQCKYQIPWYHNLPLVSWLALRGRCANCGSGIAFRYFGVELLTGLLFLAVWLRVWPEAWIVALPWWVMVSLFVVATFIDFEHFIIPDEITWGGAIAGVVLSLAIPALHGVSSPLAGALWALVGAATGYLLLWGVVEAGKLAFGKKRIAFDSARGFTWTRQGDDAELAVEGEEKDTWSNFFARPTDRLIMECDEGTIGGERFERPTLVFHYDRVETAGRRWELLSLETITGVVREVVIPREAMGFGDVKFMACVGAFLGWKAVLFTVVAASTIGAVVGLLTIACGRREWSARIPFGPYLSLGALLWTFFGPQALAWYFGQFEAPVF